MPLDKLCASILAAAIANLAALSHVEGIVGDHHEIPRLDLLGQMSYNSAQFHHWAFLYDWPNLESLDLQSHFLEFHSVVFHSSSVHSENNDCNLRYAINQVPHLVAFLDANEYVNFA